MNPEMTDAELDEAMAKEVMGWRAKRSRMGNPEWFYWTDACDTCDNRKYRLGDFRPTADLNQAVECARKWAYERDEEFWLMYKRQEDIFGCITSFGYESNKDPARAICEALLMAVRGER